ncbi:MAG: serine/threonine-protein kinase [Pirellulaceae bacterium]
MPQSPDLRSSQALPKAIGKWQPTAYLGEGNWSRVYQARPSGCSPTSPADYAIKQLRPERTDDPLARNILAREITIGQQVSHPNLSPVLDAGIAQQCPYLVMPLLTGISLNKLCCQQPLISITQAAWFLRQISQGIAALHQHGWIHADIKPGNVMLATDGHATLIDFGLARRIDSDDCAVGSPFVGTLSYAAPEMISSTMPIGPQVDVYSLGVTTFELLSGKTPFAGVSSQDLATAHLQNHPPAVRRWVPGLQREISQLLQAMLAKQPVDRPTLAEVISAYTRLEVETFAERALYCPGRQETLPRENVA